MKTIFDFNPTPSELEGAAIYQSKEEYISVTHHDKINLDIARLFSFRKKRLKMFWYLSKIKDKEIVSDFLLFVGGF
ncbi:MAG: hypothetical protein IJ150_09310 [Bacteroidales bacterium]|nr:hypothetical protein [Bacteroidales bacterium]